LDLKTFEGAITSNLSTELLANVSLSEQSDSHFEQIPREESSSHHSPVTTLDRRINDDPAGLVSPESTEYIEKHDSDNTSSKIISDSGIYSTNFETTQDAEHVTPEVITFWSEHSMLDVFYGFGLMPDSFYPCLLSQIIV